MQVASDDHSVKVRTALRRWGCVCGGGKGSNGPEVAVRVQAQAGFSARAAGADCGPARVAATCVCVRLNAFLRTCVRACAHARVCLLARRGGAIVPKAILRFAAALAGGGGLLWLSVQSMLPLPRLPSLLPARALRPDRRRYRGGANACFAGRAGLCVQPCRANDGLCASLACRAAPCLFACQSVVVSVFVKDTDGQPSVHPSTLPGSEFESASESFHSSQ